MMASLAFYLNNQQVQKEMLAAAQAQRTEPGLGSLIGRFAGAVIGWQALERTAGALLRMSVVPPPMGTAAEGFLQRIGRVKGLTPLTEKLIPIRDRLWNWMYEKTPGTVKSMVDASKLPKRFGVGWFRVERGARMAWSAYRKGLVAYWKNMEGAWYKKVAGIAKAALKRPAVFPATGSAIMLSSLGTLATYSIARVGVDMGMGIFNAIRAAGRRRYIRQAKTEWGDTLDMGVEPLIETAAARALRQTALQDIALSRQATEQAFSLVNNPYKAFRYL